MSRLMTGVSGVRGVFGESLDPTVISKYAAHFGLLCGPGKIVVGRDSRTTGPAVFAAVSAALMSVGCDVIDIGIVATPTVLLAVKHHQAAGGIAITASHNPPQWNAMKFIDADGMFLPAEKATKFLASVDEPIDWVDWEAIGKLTRDEAAIERHIQKILDVPYLDLAKIKSRKFKVVLDSVNGAGGLCSPLILRALGCEVVEINSEPSGIFAHPAEPLNHNLVQLEEAVLAHDADLGFATDPDVDRLSIVGDHGRCIGEELSVALAELFVLAKDPGDIVVNLSSSMISDHIAEQFGVKVHRTKVGEINVGKKMQELNSPIGGEGNGGVICPPVNYTRDAMAGMALILGLLAERETKLSILVDELPKYFFAKAKIERSFEELNKIMTIAPELLHDYALDTQDGIKATRRDHWIHIRKSGTEPIIRVYVESDSVQGSQEICDSTIKLLLDKIN